MMNSNVLIRDVTWCESIENEVSERIRHHCEGTRNHEVEYQAALIDMLDAVRKVKLNAVAGALALYQHETKQQEFTLERS